MLSISHVKSMSSCPVSCVYKQCITPREYWKIFWHVVALQLTDRHVYLGEHTEYLMLK